MRIMSMASYQRCGQLDGDDSHTIENEQIGQQNLISPSSTIPEQLECHIPSLPSPVIYQRCATRSRIAAAVICVVLLTFVIFTITAAKAKNNHKYKNYGLNSAEQWMAEQQALGLSQESVVVDTICGKLIGDEEHEAFVFKGIPYASPPIGSRRWSPPMPLNNDSSNCNPNGQRHTTKFGSPCFQINPYTKQTEGREDCLYLNVWTPNIDQKANLAVMVWIHGGFLQFGSGHQPGLRPSGKLAKTTDTVYVSLNYRLYAFGFMALDLLMNENNETSNTVNIDGNNSTNFGVMDVILALQWIQNNINAFGGDPKKVTLFGADSGAAIIMAIITNPDLRTLFSSSWLINPALYLNHSFSEVSKHNRKNFLKHSGCDSLECLKSLTSNKVIEYFLGKNDPSFRINDQNDLPILGIMSEQLITIDDIYVRDCYPFDLIPTDIPILIGSSSQAIDFWPGPRDLSTWQWRDYSKYVTTSLDSFGAHISRNALQLYAPIDDGNETTPAIQYINMVTDLRQVCPIDYITRNLALKSNNSSIFRYIFNARLSKPVRVYDYPSNHSFHLIDIMSYFDQIETFIRHPTEEDFSIRDSIQQIVHSFVNNHNINHNYYNNSTDNITNSSTTLSLGQSFPQQIIEINSQSNKTSIIINNYTQSDRCSFWQINQLFNYVWTV